MFENLEKKQTKNPDFKYYVFDIGSIHFFACSEYLLCIFYMSMNKIKTSI